jgi:hypothetical protein
MNRDPREFEHTRDLGIAREAIIEARQRVRKLGWISGGAGYEGMGKRELEQARLKLDEAEHWLSAATGQLNAGGKRAFKVANGRKWIKRVRRTDRISASPPEQEPA